MKESFSYQSMPPPESYWEEEDEEYEDVREALSRCTVLKYEDIEFILDKFYELRRARVEENFCMEGY